MGEKRNAYRLMVGKPEGMRPLGSLRHTWVDDVDRIDMAQDRNRWRAFVN
jgi:hypothetical protein